MTECVRAFVLLGIGCFCIGTAQAGSVEVAYTDTLPAVAAAPLAGTGNAAGARVAAFDTLIGVSDIKVSRSRNDLFLVMDLDVSRLKVRAEQEYYYVPWLRDSLGHEKALPAVLLAGRNLYYRHLRNQDVPDDVQMYDCRDLLTVGYRVTVPYEPWMETAALYAGSAVFPLHGEWRSDHRELHALSLATGLATAMALSPEQQKSLSAELEALTLTPEMQELLAAALASIAEQPAASAPEPEPVLAPESEPVVSFSEPMPEPTSEPAPAPESISEPISEPASTSEPEPTSEPMPTPAPAPVSASEPTPTSAPAPSNPELAQAIGRLGLPGEMQVRLVNEVQALPMSAELRTVLITALQTLAKAEAFVPHFVYRTPVAEERKLRSEKGTAHIEFALNETGIDPTLRDNRAELDKIKRAVDALENDADHTLKSMTVKGYASPEGPYALNASLARARTAAVEAYVRGLIHLPAGRITVDSEAEDWDGLRMVLEASDLPHKAAILKIMADTRLTPDAREWKIKSLYKDDYAYMRAYIYPALRHVDYVVEYEVRAYVDPAEIVRLLGTQPQKLSLQEMYMAAQTMAAGSEAYDEVFETAVRLFPSDETANLNAANSAMRWRDLNRAERYLAKAGQSPEAVYARGNCAALRGDYAAAERLFGEALNAGIAEAEAALTQLRALQAEASPASEQNKK